MKYVCTRANYKGHRFDPVSNLSATFRPVLTNSCLVVEAKSTPASCSNPNWASERAAPKSSLEKNGAASQRDPHSRSQEGHLSFSPPITQLTAGASASLLCSHVYSCPIPSGLSHLTVFSRNVLFLRQIQKITFVLWPRSWWMHFCLWHHSSRCCFQK